MCEAMKRTKEQLGEAVLAAVRDITWERREAGIVPDHALRIEVRRRVPMTDAELTQVLRYLRKKKHPLKMGRTVNDGYIRIVEKP